MIKSIRKKAGVIWFIGNLAVAASPEAWGKADVKKSSDVLPVTQLKGTSQVVFRKKVVLPGGKSVVFFKDGKLVEDSPARGAFCELRITSHVSDNNFVFMPGRAFVMGHFEDISKWSPIEGKGFVYANMRGKTPLSYTLSCVSSTSKVMTVSQIKKALGTFAHFKAGEGAKLAKLLKMGNVNDFSELVDPVRSRNPASLADIDAEAGTKAKTKAKSKKSHRPIAQKEPAVTAETVRQ